MKITMNKPAVDKLTADIVAGCKAVGDIADATKRVADSVTKAANIIAGAPRRGTSSWGALAWAGLLGRFTGR